MSLSIGIVGLPNVGKSTLFNALTRAGAAVAPYPFTTIDPNVGVATVPDPRLETLREIVQPEKVTPATVEFVDIAGLVRGAHRGEGLGNQFLSYVRAVDALALVCRCFTNPNVTHVENTVDPVRDLEILDLELILSDIEIVQRRLDKARTLAKARPREGAAELKLWESLLDHLRAGRRAREWFALSGITEAAIAKDAALLTAKERLYVANVDEDALPDGGELAAQVAEVAQAEGAPCVVLCAQLEAELSEWPPEEARAYRLELGMTQSGLELLAQAGYQILNLITFFTITGGREVRAWAVPRGTKAPQAAGKVHSQMEHGFIRAEVLSFEELVQTGSWHAARERGLLRVEGKDYEIQDGDICLFRFSP